MKEKSVVLDQISNSIRAAGYDPYTQLYGYLSTGNDAYITRRDDARNQIKSVDKDDLEAFLGELLTKQS